MSAGLQRVVTSLAVAAIAGMLYSNENIDVRSLANAASTKELYTVTVNSASDTDYVLTYTDVNGNVVAVTYAQGAAGTVENKVDGLVLAFNQSTAFRSAYATKTSSSTLTITARVPENAFSLTATATIMTAVNTTDASAGSSIPFGRAVAYRNVAGTECKLGLTPPARNLYTVLVSGNTDGTYVLAVEGVTFTFTASSNTATQIRDGLIALINASVAVTKSVRCVIKDADEFYVESLSDGVPITVVADNATGTGSDLTVSETTVETFGDVFAGVAMLSHTEANDQKRDLIDMASPIAGTDGYNRGAMVNVLAKGRIWVEVEEAVSPGDAVYVRYVAGASEKQGIFRKSVDSTDCVKLDNARWVVGASAAGLAVLELL